MYDHPSDYDRYGTPPPPSSSKHSSAHHAPYESSSYERDYRRDYHPHSSSYAAAAYAGELNLLKKKTWFFVTGLLLQVI